MSQVNQLAVKYRDIYFEDAKAMRVSIGMYAFLECVRFLQKKNGWCFARQELIAETIGVSVRCLKNWTSILSSEEYCLLQVADRGRLKKVTPHYERIVNQVKANIGVENTGTMRHCHLNFYMRSELGVCVGMYVILDYIRTISKTGLCEFDGEFLKLTATHIADKVADDRSKVSRSIDKLKRLGYVQFGKNSKYIRLTEKYETIAEKYELDGVSNLPEMFPMEDSGGKNAQNRTNAAGENAQSLCKIAPRQPEVTIKNVQNCPLDRANLPPEMCKIAHTPKEPLKEQFKPSSSSTGSARKDEDEDLDSLDLISTWMQSESVPELSDDPNMARSQVREIGKAVAKSKQFPKYLELIFEESGVYSDEFKSKAVVAEELTKLLQPKPVAPVVYGGKQLKQVTAEQLTYTLTNSWREGSTVKSIGSIKKFVQTDRENRYGPYGLSRAAEKPVLPEGEVCFEDVPDGVVFADKRGKKFIKVEKTMYKPLLASEGTSAILMRPENLQKPVRIFPELN